MENSYNALVFEVLDEGSAVIQVSELDVEHMRIVHTAVRDSRHFDASGCGKGCQSIHVCIPDGQTLVIDPVGFLQLCPQIGCVHIAGKIAGAIVDPGIFIHLSAEKAGAVGTLFAQDLCGVVALGIADEKSAALTHGVVFGLMEGEAAEIADRAERTPFVGGHDALSGIFDHLEVVAGGDIHDRIHLACDTCVVDSHDRAGALCDRSFNSGLVYVHRIRAHVHKDRSGAGQHDRGRRAGEGKAGDDNFVAGFETAKDRSHFKGGCTAGGQQNLLRVETVLNVFMAQFGKLAVSADLVCINGLADICQFCPYIRWNIKWNHVSLLLCCLFAQSG